VGAQERTMVTKKGRTASLSVKEEKGSMGERFFLCGGSCGEFPRLGEGQERVTALNLTRKGGFGRGNDRSWN